MPYTRKTIDPDEEPPPKPKKQSEATGQSQKKSDYDPKKASKSYQSEPLGGPVTENYSEFIQKVFSPDNHVRRAAAALADYSDMGYTSEIPASLQLKVELMEAAAELRSKGCDIKLSTPLDSMPDLYSRYGFEDKATSKYSAYEPKSSPEYFSIANRKSQSTEPTVHYKSVVSGNTPNYWNYKTGYESTPSRSSGTESRRYSPQATPNHYVIDYSNFRTAPLSPYMYNDSIKRHDSRIVGSDFVMLTIRPKDAFLEKIDKTLAEARKINSWST